MWAKIRSRFGRPTSSPPPTVIHVTHWKAGSQWVYKILRECWPDRIVHPKVDNVQFLREPIQAGKIYPTVYVTWEEYESVSLPENSHRFVVVRDLRDTLISAYFSIKISHPVVDPRIERWRAALHARSLEDGLLYLMEEWLPLCARIQASWVRRGEPLFKYEHLLYHDVEILERVLIDTCRLDIPRERLREVVRRNRFENLTRGRKPGEEDVTAHERKGIAGDWKNYFTPRLKERFKTKYGSLLIATGYESDMEW